MKIWKTKFFHQWQKKALISDEALIVAVDEIKRGLIDADLGGGLIKKRVPRPGAGKRSGHRTLPATNKQGKYFFVYGFAKNERENINEAEENALKKLGATLLNMTVEEFENAIKNNELKRISHEKK